LDEPIREILFYGFALFLMMDGSDFAGESRQQDVMA